MGRAKGAVRARLGPGLLLLGSLGLPLLSPPYFTHVATLALIYSVFALGLQILTGFAGQLSLGQAAFFGVGAYVSALLALRTGLPFWLTAPAATAASALLGACLAPITRLRGHELAVATLGFGEIVYLVLVNWVDVTRGPFGLLNIPPPALGGLVFGTAFEYYYLALAATVGAALLVARLGDGRSRFGRGLRAIRENELAAIAVGVAPTRYKLQAFVLSAALAGLAGSLFAHFDGYLNPGEFRLDSSILVLLMVVVGGLGRVGGAILGAVLLVLAGEYLRFLKEYRMLAYGGMLIACMIAQPGGLMELADRLGALVRPGGLTAARHRTDRPPDRAEA